MIGILTDTAPKARVIEEDALKADLGALLESLPEPRAVVSNLPYYITGPLLTRVAEARARFDRAVLMMQKEVADRVVAKPGDSARGSLSVFLQAQFEISKVASVPAGSFYPPPKVDSTVLLFVPTASGDNQALFDMVRRGFTQPRKTLANNLAGHSGVRREAVAAILESIGLDARVRPHVLTLDQWRQVLQQIGE